MSKKLMEVVVLLAVASAFATGCATTKRAVTNTVWRDTPSENHLYLSYWEGTCRMLMGCSKGDSHVKLCTAEKDNELKCEDQSEIDKLLNQ
jgi:hypothetical protein